MKELQIKGEKLYDSFLETLFGKKRIEIKISNPHTNTLELFALLDRKRDKTKLVGAMCSEFAHDALDENLFVENGELYERITIKRLA